MPLITPPLILPDHLHLTIEYATGEYHPLSIGILQPISTEVEVYHCLLINAHIRYILYHHVCVRRRIRKETIIVHHPLLTIPILLEPHTSDTQVCQELSEKLKCLQDGLA